MNQIDFHIENDAERSSCMEDFAYLKSKEIHFCPVCGKELIYNGDRKLETLDEHVSNPNGEIVPKLCLVCDNKYCISNLLQFRWNSSGDFYIFGNFYDTNQIKFKDNIHSSIGSWQRKYDEKKEWEKSRTFHIKFGKWDMWDFHLMLEFFFPNNPLHWSMTIWWKGHWVMNIPGTIQWKIKRTM